MQDVATPMSQKCIHNFAKQNDTMILFLSSIVYLFLCLEDTETREEQTFENHLWFGQICEPPKLEFSELEVSLKSIGI